MSIRLENGDGLLLESGDRLTLEDGDSPGSIEVEGPLGAPRILALLSGGYVEVPGPLGDSAVFAYANSGSIAVPGPLDSLPARLLGYSDYTPGLTGLEIITYEMYLVTPDGDVRVPISSWQATLQVGHSNYVQCVVPAVLDWVDAIEVATAFRVYRVAGIVRQVMASIEISTPPMFYQGPQRYTCTLSGYADGYPEIEDPDPIFDRTLQGIQTTTMGSGRRVRCSVDWLLRPGQRAYLDDATSIIADYINYYCTLSAGSVQEYMDVGERA